MVKKDIFLSVREISPEESKRIILVMISLILFSLMNVYFNPLKYFLREILYVETINGCPLLTFTGIPCPTCGMGRSFSCLTDMDISGSIYRNPLSPLFFITTGFIFVMVLVLAFMKRKLVLTEGLRKHWYLPVIFILLMWILNILYGHHE